MIIQRRCLVCGKRMRIKIGKKGKRDKGHYYGRIKVPIEGTGEWKKVGKTKVGRHALDVVDWTGKENEFEYWECNDCFDEAAHECWLEETIEKLYGKRCKKYEMGCGCCEAWRVYDIIRQSRNNET